MRVGLSIAIAAVLWGLPVSAKDDERAFVYGKGFALSLRPPEGWTDYVGSREDSDVEIVLRKSSFPNIDLVCPRDGKAIVESILIYLDRKPSFDEPCELSSGIIHSYEEDLPIANPRYATESKVIHFGEFGTLYASMLDPGPASPVTVTVVLPLTRDVVSEEDLKTFADVVLSISFRAAPKLKEVSPVPDEVEAMPLWAPPHRRR